MCFYTEIRDKDGNKYVVRFKSIIDFEEWVETGEYNGFAHPLTPVIFNDAPGHIKLGKWGLLPFWAKDPKFANNTLNAKIETIEDKPSFRNYVTNRCLVLVDGFFEWKWLDEKGKQKQKYNLRRPGNKPFALAGIWSDNKGERTYSIVTTEANELMAEIHNNKKRMPVVLTAENEEYWLKGGDMEDFKTCDVKLDATAV